MKRLLLIASILLAALAVGAAPASATSCVVTADISYSFFNTGGAKYATLTGRVVNSCAASYGVAPYQIGVVGNLVQQGVTALDSATNSKLGGGTIAVNLSEVVYCGPIGGPTPLLHTFYTSGYGWYRNASGGLKTTSATVTDTVKLYCVN